MLLVIRSNPSSYPEPAPPACFGLNEASKTLIVGEFALHLLKRKKEPKLLFSKAYRSQWTSVDHNLERETRLELATPTLARSCSTN